MSWSVTICRLFGPISTRLDNMSLSSTCEWPLVEDTPQSRHVDGAQLEIGPTERDSRTKAAKSIVSTYGGNVSMNGNIIDVLSLAGLERRAIVRWDTAIVG